MIEFTRQDSRCTICGGHFPGSGEWSFFQKNMLDLLEFEQRLEAFLAENLYGLVDLQVTSSGRGRTFSLFVERADGTSADLNDCVRLTPLVRLYLESQQVYNDCSALQVSSPGLARVLKRDRDFERHEGERVTVSFRIEGRKYTLAGGLAGCTSSTVLLETDEFPRGLEEAGIARENGVVSVPRNLTTEVRLKAEG